jgi:hypothetical protein
MVKQIKFWVNAFNIFFQPLKWMNEVSKLGSFQIFKLFWNVNGKINLTTNEATLCVYHNNDICRNLLWMIPKIYKKLRSSLDLNVSTSYSKTPSSNVCQFWIIISPNINLIYGICPIYDIWKFVLVVWCRFKTWFACAMKCIFNLLGAMSYWYVTFF